MHSISNILSGCASHRFNLQVQKYFSNQEQLLSKVNQLMSKLRTLKVSGMDDEKFLIIIYMIIYNYFLVLIVAGLLREYTNIRPQIRCGTRWSGDFTMIKRYFELREHLPIILETFPDIEEYCLSIIEENTLKSINDCMNNFQDITFMLQKKELTLGEMRVLFDGVIQKYPTMNEYLSTTSNIVEYPEFEHGMLKKHSHFSFYFIIIVTIVVNYYYFLLHF